MRISTRTRPIATFNGRHNKAKCKVLLVLFNLKYAEGNDKGLTARELHLSSGVNYKYLLSRLHIWTAWNYLLRYPSTDDNGKIAWRYRIGHYGSKFIRKAESWGAPVERYAKEIRAFRASRLKKDIK